MSRLAALLLEVHDRMAGMFLAFARFGEKTIIAVATRGGQLVFDAPDFPQDIRRQTAELYESAADGAILIS